MSLCSLSNLAAIFQVTIQRVRAAAKAADITPKLVLDGVPYFAESDARLIGEALGRGQR